jgi:hypothetical protein
MSIKWIVATIIGRDWETACAECGERAHCSPLSPEFDSEDAPVMPLICRRFHPAEASVADKRVGPGDRIMAARFKTPLRWDVIVFLFPEDPALCSNMA